MTPNTAGLLFKTAITNNEMPTLTYKIKNNRIVGLIDKREALEQAISLILQTERFIFCIYSWNYGSELSDIYSYEPMLAKARICERIKEALMADFRVKDVGNFVIQQLKGKYIVEFNVYSIYGNIEYKGEI